MSDVRCDPDGGEMEREELSLVRNLLSESRLLSLGVLVDGKPHVGLLPYVVATDFRSALIRASQLARHSRGLQPGSPYSALIHACEEQQTDALQVPRVTISGTVQLVAQADVDYETSRQTYVDRFPSSEQTFHLGDFNLYKLHFEWGRLVSGFARAITLSPDSFRELATT
jgi:putative heme iron utilization protein